jgi:hypothetical protein
MLGISAGGITDLTKFDQQGGSVFRRNKIKTPPLTPEIVFNYFASQFL